VRALNSVLFRIGFSYTFLACFGHVKIAVAYYEAVCTIYRGWGLVKFEGYPFGLLFCTRVLPGRI